PDYLKAMRIPLARGRFLTPADDEHTPFVTVIDDRFAQLYFRGQDPIGKRVNFNILNTSAEIVGVVGHVKQWDLAESAPPIQAECYFALPQLPDQFVPLLARNAAVVVRTAGPPGPGGLDTPSDDPGQQPASNVRHGDDGEHYLRFALGSAFLDDSHGRVCRARAGHGECRNLRRDFLPDGPADARDRHSHGAGRAACGRVETRRWTRLQDDPDRRW